MNDKRCLKCEACDYVLTKREELTEAGRYLGAEGKKRLESTLAAIETHWECTGVPFLPPEPKMRRAVRTEPKSSFRFACGCGTEFERRAMRKHACPGKTRALLVSQPVRHSNSSAQKVLEKVRGGIDLGKKFD